MLVDGRLEEADARLAALFATYPAGREDVWAVWQRVHAGNIGSPPAYSALRMLDEIVRVWKRTPPQSGAYRSRMTVVLVDCAQGYRPTDLAFTQPGEPVNLKLRPELAQDDYRILRESTRLFGLYVEAMTERRITLDVAFQTSSACVDVGFDGAQEASGILDGLSPIRALPPSVVEATDMFWIVYPTNVPSGPPFQEQHFITGGVTATGTVPVIMIDDAWMLRHAPHMGTGPMHDVERRVYLPQWFQHEFFHYLFWTWPEHELEKTSHQWFDRSSWPNDFTGFIEADYYAEALGKRLRTSTPALHVGLKTRPSSPASLAHLSASSFVGTYRRLPRENDWHDATISLEGGALRWSNAATVSWSLSWKDGTLTTGADCPYGVMPLPVKLKRDSEGNELLELEGLYFTSELYRRIP